MDKNDIIELLLINLNMNMPSQKTEVQKKIESNLNFLADVAIKRIEEEGIIFVDSFSVEDANLVVMYASWLYSKRTAGEQPMPRMLRYALNNRLFSQKAKNAE